MNNEIWRDILNYEEYYQASNYGRIRSLDRIIYMKHRNGKNKAYHFKGKILSTRTNNSGYVKVDLTKNKNRKTFSVHRLVAETFIPNLKNLPQVNHKDGNKLNNNVDNLEWCDAFQNQQHALETGLRKQRTLSKSEYQKLYYQKNREKRLLQSKLNYLKRKELNE